MNFLKKSCVEKNGISIFQIKDYETNKVTSFYKISPFPNYKLDDNKSTILEKGNKNYLTSKFKKFIGFNKDVKKDIELEMIVLQLVQIIQ